MKAGLYWALVLGGGGAVLWLSASRYYPFFADDALISLRYAERLLAGRGLTWNDGERVEGYSNLLWILACAALGRFGVDLILAARILGVTATFVAIALCVRSARAASPLPALATFAMLAVTTPIAVWSIGGLEQPLSNALLAGVLTLALSVIDGAALAPRAAWTIGVLLALVCLTRPDGALFAGAIGLGLLVLERKRGRTPWSALLVLGLPGVALLGQEIFRILYYHDWLPNTARIKVHASRARLQQGFDYLELGYRALWPSLSLVVPGFYAAAFHAHKRARTLFVLLLCALWAAYVVAIGGDIFPAYRHQTPLLVLLGFIAVQGLAWLTARYPVWWQQAPIAIACALLAREEISRQRTDIAALRAIYERWEWDGEVIGRMFREGFAAERPLLAVTAAGTLPYFSRLPCIDMLGLNDRHTARQPPDLRLPIGHDHGDGRYVLDRKADLIAFGVGGDGHPDFLAGFQMLRDPRFARDYLLVGFQGFEPYPLATRVFVRRNGRVGVRREADRIRVPAYLLMPGGIAQLEPSSRRMGARIDAFRSLSTGALDLGPGIWRLKVIPDSGFVHVAAVNLGALRLLARSASEPAIALASSGQVELRITPAIDTVLEAIELERVSDDTSATGPGWQALAPGQIAALRPAPRDPSLPSSGQVLGRFDTGLDGWRLRGSFARSVSPAVVASRHIAGQSGGFLDSYDHVQRDLGFGTAESPSFVVPKDAWLEFRIGGGVHDVGVRLREGERVVQEYTGFGGDYLRTVRFDLFGLRGRRLSIEAFDRSIEPGGHVLLDEVVLRQPAR